MFTMVVHAQAGSGRSALSIAQRAYKVEQDVFRSISARRQTRNTDMRSVKYWTDQGFTEKEALNVINELNRYSST